MRWDEERYVRLYTRDTVQWHMWPWETKALFCLLLRKVDRAGIMELGDDGLAGMALVVQMPLEVVERAIQPLLKGGTIEINDSGTVIMPNYIEAQESVSTPASRQRDSRERRRDMLRKGLHPGQRTCVVYFIQSEHGGAIKIGFAEDVARRLVQLQTSRPDRLVILASCRATVEDEARVHRSFEQWREKGEWFSPFEGLMCLVKEVASAGAIPSDLSRFVTGHMRDVVTIRDESPRTVPDCAVPTDPPKPPETPAEPARGGANEGTPPKQIPAVVIPVTPAAAAFKLQVGTINFERSNWIAAYERAVERGRGGGPFAFPKHKLSGLVSVIEKFCPVDDRQMIDSWVEREVEAFVRAVRKLEKPPEHWHRFEPDGFLQWHNDRCPGRPKAAAPKAEPIKPVDQQPTLSPAENAAHAKRLTDMLAGGPLGQTG